MYRVSNSVARPCSERSPGRGNPDALGALGGTGGGRIDKGHAIPFPPRDFAAGSVPTVRRAGNPEAEGRQQTPSPMAA